MKVTIEIECEDFQEIMTHLNVIKETLEYKNNKVEIDACDLTKNPISFTDNNCYGFHSVTINE